MKAPLTPAERSRRYRARKRKCEALEGPIAITISIGAELHCWPDDGANDEIAAMVADIERFSHWARPVGRRGPRE